MTRSPYARRAHGRSPTSLHAAADFARIFAGQIHVRWRPGATQHVHESQVKLAIHLELAASRGTTRGQHWQGRVGERYEIVCGSRGVGVQRTFHASHAEVVNPALVGELAEK